MPNSTIPFEDLSIAHLAHVLEAAYFDINELGETHIDLTRTYRMRLSLTANNRFILLTAVFTPDKGETKAQLVAHAEAVNAEMVALKAYVNDELDTIYELGTFCGTGIEGKALVRFIDEFMMMIRAALEKQTSEPDGFAAEDDDVPPTLLN